MLVLGKEPGSTTLAAGMRAASIRAQLSAKALQDVTFAFHLFFFFVKAKVFRLLSVSRNGYKCRSSVKEEGGVNFREMGHMHLPHSLTVGFAGLSLPDGSIFSQVPLQHLLSKEPNRQIFPFNFLNNLILNLLSKAKPGSCTGRAALCGILRRGSA